MPLEASATNMVHVYGKEWRLARPDDTEDKVKSMNIEFEIIGDDRNGFHLCMTAEECNTYDVWFSNIDEAIASALESHAVPVDSWSRAK
jgi:hypothetical protein